MNLKERKGDLNGLVGRKNLNNWVKSFKQFFKESQKPVFSEKEKIYIKDVGGPFMAKVDSGNDAFCVLHGEDVKIDGDKVTFKSFYKDLTKDLINTIKINVGAGVEEERPIVKFDIMLNDKIYRDVEFSIGNRETNEEKILLGLKFLKPLKATIKL